MIYRLHLWWLQYLIRLCAHRRKELDAIMERERAAIDYEENHLNARLRELQSARLHSNLTPVKESR